jgi:glycosyltransferase involved in cell wall biosynthesis
MKTPTVGCLIRFKNSASTLPQVLKRLRDQTLPPDTILGVDTGSTDGSADLIRAAGGQVITWTQPYNHSKVLNFGMAHLPTDLALILSSHTTLEDDDALERMVAALAEPRVACVSAKWDDDPFYSDAIGWKEIRQKGLKFGSIYSNSMGMLRRSYWQDTPFDETIPTAEDYAWAMDQLFRGRLCRRLKLHFDYQRSGHSRDYEFARLVFRLARKHRLRVTWLGVRPSVKLLLKKLLSGSSDTAPHSDRLLAWAGTRLA